jgi:hypothetical protein
MALAAKLITSPGPPVTDAATELSGAKFGVLHNTIDERGAAFMLYAFRVPREAFEHFGQPRATDIRPDLQRRRTDPLRDVLTDPRYGKCCPSRHAADMSRFAVIWRFRCSPEPERIGGLS